MKTSLIFSLLIAVFAAFLTALNANASIINQATPQSYSFEFKTPKTKSFLITKKALSKDMAFKLAARECYSKLTGGKYPGEEKGLEIIDICANPKM